MVVAGKRNHTTAVQQGHIWWRLWFLGEVRVPPVRVICVVVRNSGWWLV